MDISSVLSPFGQGVLLFLIQLGGLGVMTYTSIIFLLWRNNVPFTNREAVSQALLGGDFNLAAFVRQVLALVFSIEAIAAMLLYLHDPRFFHPFSAVFHAVSSFCNAGFALSPDNLMPFRDDPVVNLVIAGSVILGGIGFGVLREFLGLLSGGRFGAPVHRLSRFSRLVVKTSLFLIVAGTVLIFCIEFFRAGNEQSVGDGFDLAITSFFQSVIARTAGFNSVDMAALSEASPHGAHGPDVHRRGGPALARAASRWSPSGCSRLRGRPVSRRPADRAGRTRRDQGQRHPAP